MPEESGERSISRRELFKIAGATGAGVVLGGVGTGGVASNARGATGSVPFFGVHQAGIDTPLQQHILFAAFDQPRTTSRRCGICCCGSGRRRRH